MKLTALSDVEQRILADAKKVITTINGEDVTRFDSVLLELNAKKDRPEVARLILQYYSDASRAESALREQIVRQVLAYKEHWGPIFAMKRKLGKPLPRRVYPDPDDIVLRSDGTVKFLGPVSEQEARDWERFWDWRETMFLFAREAIEAAGLFGPIEKDRQWYLKLRRSYYRVNRHLPASFKRKYPARFPAFSPPASPPDWYEEDDRELTDTEHRMLVEQAGKEATAALRKKFNAFGRLA